MSQQFNNSPKFLKTGSLYTCKKWYNFLGNNLVVVSLVKMELFQCDDCGDGDALIKSSVKHYKTNLRND